MTSLSDALEKEPFSSIVGGFDVGACLAVETVSSGLIHQTFRVQTEQGLFCLQALHPKLATDEILADYQRVLSYLEEQQFPAPRLIETSAGEATHIDEAGKRWRLTSWLSGKTYDMPTDYDQIRSAAALLGRFHRTMSGLSYEFQSNHPLHDTPHHLRRLAEATTEAPTDVLVKVKPLIDVVVDALPELLLPEGLPQHVVHGDPKISNVMFNDDNEAVAMIDLDTCNRHSILVDVGDAVRSWCREGGEDQARPFDRERFVALIAGYASTAPKLTGQELGFLPEAGRLITLELAARFLTDYIEDHYFGWDEKRYPSRRAHNFARATGMLFLAQQMEEATPFLEETVGRLF